MEPPSFVASYEHDDWVSSVDVLSAGSAVTSWHPDSFVAGQERILSASFDGLLRMWDKSGRVIATSPGQRQGGHTTTIRSAKFISPTQIVSCSEDRTIRVWKYTESQNHSSAEFKPILALYGHRHFINNIAVHGPTSRIVSASSDGAVGVWSTSKSEAPPAPPAQISTGSRSKHRKTSTSTSNPPQRGPLSLIQAHSQLVTAVDFHPNDSTVAYSSSVDHSVRTLDLETSTVVSTRATSHPILSLTALPFESSSHILAAGSMARHITLIDPRVASTTTAIMTLRGHTSWISSFAPDPDNIWGLVSGGYDGTCRVWDIRNTRQGTRDEGNGLVSESVYIIKRERTKDKKPPVAGAGIKIYDVAWDRDLGIISASEDKTMQFNKGTGVTGPAGASGAAEAS